MQFLCSSSPLKQWESLQHCRSLNNGERQWWRQWKFQATQEANLWKPIQLKQQNPQAHVPQGTLMPTRNLQGMLVSAYSLKVSCVHTKTIEGAPVPTRTPHRGKKRIHEHLRQLAHQDPKVSSHALQVLKEINCAGIFLTGSTPTERETDSP